MDGNYKLENLLDLSYELHKPLHTTSRIKYTCFDASKTYITCGATSGSIYVFQRKPCKFLQLIPNLSGAINHIAISPQENYVAFTTQKGSIHIYVVDLTTVQPTILSSHYHDMLITQIQWKLNEKQLFLGDVKGNVFLVNLNIFLGRGLTMSIHPVLFLESPIVQICEFEHLLLVSNYNKCILCNTETEEFKQIGNQPRDGKFGACFLWDPKRMRVACARPGCRIWECNIDGNVLKTHKFKSIVESEPPIDIDFSTVDQKCDDHDFTKHQINEQLFDLQNLNRSLMLARTSNAFYIFDIERSSVALWTNRFGNIHTIRAINGESNCFLLFTADQKAYTFQLNRSEERFYETIENKEQYSNDTEIIYDEKRSHDTTSYINLDNKLKDLTLAEEKPIGLSEEDKILQNLFFLYKSLKVSKFNMKDRYAELFDAYDFQDIKKFLRFLQAMIVENDVDVTEIEAKKICAEIYLDYIKVDSIHDFSEESETFVLDCFVMVNTPVIEDCHVQRCDDCNFPLIVSNTNLKYSNIAKVLVKKLIEYNKIEMLFNVIASVPATMAILLENLLTGSLHFGAELDNMIDIYFACGSQTDIVQYSATCEQFKTYSFWSEFFTRLIRLHNQNLMQCCRCKKICQIDFKSIETEPFYSYNHAFNKCVHLINGSAALQLCSNVAKHIPCNGIDRNFFIECLLKS